MKTVQHKSLLIMTFLAGATAVMLIHAVTAPAEIAFPYKKEECVQCHATEVNGRATSGGKHRSVPCFGCHVGHPPDVPKPIEPCNKCHLKTRKAHFSVGDCLDCHTNPHTPLKITFDKRQTCFNCHGTQTEQLNTHPSKHAELGCHTCHDVHRKKPECTQCHVPHSGKVTRGCTKCHNPHMPKLVTYPDDIPSKDCGACHEQPASLLAVNTSKHKNIECARCHQGKHRTVPKCQDCHGSPHPKSIMFKFPKCGMCHNVAHSLNNWFPDTSKAKAAAPAATPKGAK